mgnify:CR=1 FL=1|jgi:hypothetical protein
MDTKIKIGIGIISLVVIVLFVWIITNNSKISELESNIEDSNNITNNITNNDITDKKKIITDASAILGSIIGVSILLSILYYQGFIGDKPSAATPGYKYSGEICYIWFGMLYCISWFIIGGEIYKLQHCNTDSAKCEETKLSDYKNMKDIKQLIITRDSPNPNIKVKTTNSFCSFSYNCHSESDKTSLTNIINDFCNTDS